MNIYRGVRPDVNTALATTPKSSTRGVLASGTAAPDILTIKFPPMYDAKTAKAGNVNTGEGSEPTLLLLSTLFPSGVGQRKYTVRYDHSMPAIAYAFCGNRWVECHFRILCAACRSEEITRDRRLRKRHQSTDTSSIEAQGSSQRFLNQSRSRGAVDAANRERARL